MKTKFKIMMCLLIFIIGGIINIYFTTALHQTLTGKTKILEYIPLVECIKSIISEKVHLMLFLCFQGFIVLLLVLFFIQSKKTYQSDLIKLTPDIKTPVPVGQYQHGSAKWLTDEEKDKAFESFIINQDNKIIKELIENGYDTLDFTKKVGKEDV